ncbi:MAG: hypothetical protein BWK79_14885 [Beggiatoa sp. IS2]|nr:MAG: hypothetical protein BWK79_14885 [Beggiatoa sp. IS2]
MTIYKFLDEEGVLHLTNKPPHKREKILYARSYVVESYQPPPLPPAPVVENYPTTSLRKNNDYVALIADVALQTGLPAALLHAVIKVESNYNPHALSPKGAKGLMQLMPGTAKRYGVTDRADPTANVYAGASYLRDLFKMFNQDLSLTLAAYNAGENAVKRYGNTIPPYRETQNYVKKVQSLYQQYSPMM